ncbi:MAG: hypothetical protein JO020_21955 [Chloroflexi bacterium]|nr:hypothetical protein [Chloroflexota bacterium]
MAITIRSHMTFRLCAAVCAALLALPMMPSAVSAQSAPCGLPNAAFCDTFNQATPNGPDIRSGDLDGVVWGVSRSGSNDDPSQGATDFWAAAAPTASTCGSQKASPPKDVLICNGQLFETVNDAGGFEILGMYPRQPFDIAGRTGTVVFDVSADSQCSHCAWPAFLYTDQPVPAPYNSQDLPRNSFGIAFDATPGFACADSTHTTAMDMWTTQNYQEKPVDMHATGCVAKATAGGPLNHIEVRISPTHVEVWGTDPGANNLHQLAWADVQMPLTRGLVWMNDIHYNAAKDGTQRTHTFAWDNFGFDGPVLPRDLGFDVKDNQNSGGSGDEMLGYKLQQSLTLNINNVNSLDKAAGALLEFTFTPHNQATINYAFNGHPAHSQAWPYGGNAQTFQSKTLAVPVPLEELVPGTNTVVLTVSPADVMTVANVDLILVGAGGTVAPAGSAAPVVTNPAPPAAAPAADQPAPATDQPAQPSTDANSGTQSGAQVTDADAQQPAPQATDADAPSGTAQATDTGAQSSTPSGDADQAACEVQVRINGELVWKPAPASLCQ